MNNKSVIKSSFENLVSNFSKLPTIGQKTAKRLAAYIINSDKDFVNSLTESIQNAKNNINFCKICHNYSETELCRYCSDYERDKSVICLVEEPLDIINMEQTLEFKGVYHVLNGLISIQNGIGPSDINIDSLLNRITNNNISEIIVALNPTVDGDSTTLYIKKKILEINPDIKITRLAMGLPSGSVIEYTDKETLSRALQHRIAI